MQLLELREVVISNGLALQMNFLHLSSFPLGELSLSGETAELSLASL